MENQSGAIQTSCEKSDDRRSEIERDKFVFEVWTQRKSPEAKGATSGHEVLQEFSFIWFWFVEAP